MAEERDLREQLEEQGEEIVDYVETYSPRPAVDKDRAERLLRELPPVYALEELDKMASEFQSGAGAATGRRSMPARQDPPTDDVEPRQPADPQ